MNTSAPSRLTIFTTLISSGWCAPAWSTASCPAAACGARRMPLLEPLPLARRIRWAQTSFPRAAPIFSRPAKKPASNGSSSGVSAHLNLDYDGCFFHCSCTLHRIRKTSIVAAFRLVRIEWEKGTAFEGDDHASKLAVGRLWIKAGSLFPDGNAGAVGFHHRAHNDAGGYHSTSLRTGWQRHLARLCAGDGGDSSGCVMHQPLRALLGFARLALYLRFDDSSAVARGHCRVEPVARIHRHRIERYRRGFSFCPPPVFPFPPPP